MNAPRRLCLALLIALSWYASAFAQQPVSNLVSGSGNASNTNATTIIAAPTNARRIYVSSVQCGRTDAGTTAVRATLNDDGGTVIVLQTGGSYVPLVFPYPLTVAAATALTFTMSSGVSTAYCNAQGFTGN